MASSSMLHSYIVCYDISNGKRRRKVAQLLSRNGYRVQESVFEIQLTARNFERLLKQLKKWVDYKADRLTTYPVPLTTLERVVQLGTAPPEVVDEEMFYL
jgi:CRISPR-associated protein Cas2